MDWDVFISHAWEDKEDIARPLAEALRRKGLRVWYDEFTLTLGDSLRRSIDRGLAQSSYGVVILSPNFFAKEWPQKELDGLAAREVHGEKVILPVWHNITAEQVRKHSSTLADRVAVSSDRGFDHVVGELLRVIKPASESLHLPVRIEPPIESATRVSGMGQPGETVIIRDLSQPGEPTLSTGTIQPDGTFSIPLSLPLMGGHVIAAVTDTGAVSRQVVKALALTETPTPMPELGPPTTMKRSHPFEPKMIFIPAGEFLMGSDPLIDKDANDDEQPQHSLYLPDYYLSKTPVTNVQYAAFVQATGYNRPKHWDGGKPPKGKEDHPVVYVSWYDAVAYCRWLSEATGKSYHLPSEAEWEKGARGSDGRIYPWGNQWDAKRCNSEKDPREGDTTPVEAYPQGASPYGLLDMAGNVWEWTRSLWGKDASEPYFEYPYNPKDGRENLKASNNVRRVLRSGAFVDLDTGVRCARRHSDEPDLRSGKLGFRVVVSQVERTSAKPRRRVNWEKVGAIAQVIGVLIAVVGLLIALGQWLVPNAADFLSAWLSETPTVTPTSSPAHTPVIPTTTPTNTPSPHTATFTLIPAPLMLTPVLPIDTPMPSTEPTSSPVYGGFSVIHSAWAEWKPFPILNVTLMNGTDRTQVITQLRVVIAQGVPYPGLPPQPRVLEPIAMWDIELPGGVNTFHQYEPTEPILIPSEDATTISLRLFSSYKGEPVHPDDYAHYELKFVFICVSGLEAETEFFSSPFRSREPTDTLTLTTTLTVGPPPGLAEAGQVWVSPIDKAEMVYVPAGDFTMGSNMRMDENPVHIVYLDAFYIDKTEVTNAQFAQFLSEQGNQEEGDVTWLDIGEKDCLISQSGGQHQPKNGYEDHPVVEVSWYGARAYCQWAGKRLPTEAEWEKAARGTDGREYPWGEGIDCDHAQYNECGRGTVPVGSKPKGASPYGVLDMAGNVWEWVADWYDKDYYSQSPERNPPGPDSGELRVLRGGSWFDDDWPLVPSTYRSFGLSPKFRINYVGFRCARGSQ